MTPPPLPDQESDLATSIVGLWGLVSREDRDESGTLLVDPHLGADPLGLLAFSGRHFSAQFSKRDRTDSTGRVAASSANNSAAVGGYDAYFGRYWIDDSGRAIVVHLEGSINPENVGKEFTRDVWAGESALIVRLGTVTDDGIPITRTLTFERLA